MQCLKCPNDTLPGKALCPACFEQHQARFGEGNRANFTREAMEYTREVFSSSEGEPAGFWLRFFAVQIDLFVCVLLGKIVAILMTMFALGAFLSRAAMGASSSPGMVIAVALGAAVLLIVVSLLVSVVYSVWFESSQWQGGFGKRLFRIKVINSEGERLSVPHAFGRAIAHKIPLFFVVLVFLGIAMHSKIMIVASAVLGTVVLFVQYPMAAITPYKQALHDKIVGTYVVKSGVALTGFELVWRIALSLFVMLLMVSASDVGDKQKSIPKSNAGVRVIGR